MVIAGKRCEKWRTWVRVLRAVYSSRARAWIVSIGSMAVGLSRLGKQRMQAAVPGIEDFGAFVDLQRDADGPPGHQRREMRSHCGSQRLSAELLHTGAAATCHAQVQ